MIPAAERRWPIAALAAGGAGVALALLIAVLAGQFWPGVAMYDTIMQYRQVLGAPVDDWHPPVMVRVWQLLHPLATGTTPMFVLQVGLYAVGFGLIAAGLVRSGRWLAALATAILALSPLLFGWQMVILKDAQMLAALIAAVGVLALYRLAGQALPLPAITAAALLIGYATLLRANAVFATAPLAVLLLPTRNRPLFSAALGFAGIGAVVALSPTINHAIFQSVPSGIERVQPLFDLAAIAVKTPASEPSVFTPEERAQIISRHCVKAYFWDPLGDPDGCEDATDRVMDQPARQLYLELAGAIVRHPIAYASHRLAHWNSTERWLVAPGLPDAEPNDVGLVGTDSSLAVRWQQWADDEMATPLGWPIVWTTISLLLLPIAWWRRSEPAGALALALVGSAIVLEASFLVISIASDLRYHLWPMSASALALIILADRLRARWWQWGIVGMALAAVIAGGVIARDTLPRAPTTYTGMVQAAS